MGVIKYAFLKSTFNPSGRFFMTWEIFRIIFAAITTILFIGFENLFLYLRWPVFYILRFMDVTALADLYVRLHCQYYNEKGIIVTHPWCTFKHYLSTSFAIDMISYFPNYYFKMHYLFGSAGADTTKMLLKVIPKPLQMYRFFGFLTYFQSKILNRYASVAHAIRFLLIVTLAIGIASVLISTQVCSKIGKDEVVSIIQHLENAKNSINAV